MIKTKLFHNLAGYRLFWRMWNKIVHYKSWFNKNSYSTKTYINKKKNSLSDLRREVSKYAPQFIILLCAIFFLEWLETKIELVNFLKTILPDIGLKNKPDNSNFIDIAVLFITTVAIYFASISIIASTSYLKLPTETKSILWEERGNNFVYNYLVTLAILSVMLCGVSNFGYDTGYIIFISTIFLSLLGIVIFVIFTIRLFGFFSPISLFQTYFIPIILNHIEQITVDRRQFRELQNSSQNKVDFYLTLVENIIRNTFPVSRSNSGEVVFEATFSGVEIEEFFKQFFYILTYYSSCKQNIPHDSLWYKKRSKHKSYFESDYSEINITHRLDTTMLATETPDLMWLEKKIAIILELIFNHIFLTKNYRLCAIALNAFQIHLETIIERADHNTAIFILENLAPKLQGFILDIKPKFQEIEKNLIDNSILEPLAISDYYGCIFISVILGYRKRIEGLCAKIDNVDFSSKKGLYTQNFPSEIIVRLEDLQKRLKFEIAVEGEIITQKYYIDQLVATAALEFISKIPDKVIKLLDEEVIKFSAKMIEQKNYLMLLPLFDRILEAINKGFSFANQLEKDENEIAKFIRINDIPHIRTNVEDFRKKLMERRRTILEYFPKLSAIASLIPKHDSAIPDYFGNYYFRLSQVCVEAIVKNDAELFLKLFPAYFLHSFSVYHYLCGKISEGNANKEYWMVRISDVIMNLLIISGYALIYREIGQKEIWEAVDKQWKDVPEILKRDSLKDALHAMIQITSTNIFYASPTNQIRFEWERLVKSDLLEKKIIEERDTSFFGRELERKHQSNILGACRKSTN